MSNLVKSQGAGRQAPIDDVQTSVKPNRLFGRLRRQPLFWIASIVLIAICLIAGLGPLLVEHDPSKQSLVNAFAPPSWEHLLGADRFGRDVLSRLVSGTRVAVLASLEATLVAWVFGVPLGIYVGFRGGWWDRVVMRAVDMLSAVPPLITALMIIALIGKGLATGMFAIGFTLSTAMLRISRGATLAVREELYIDAARVNGLSTWSILGGHVLPNIAGVIIVRTTQILGLALIAEASLSFIGLGAQPPTASWGTMLADAAQYFGRHPSQAIAPGIAIAITVLAINFLGDVIGDNVGAGSRAGYLRADAATNVVAPARTIEAAHLVEVEGLQVAVSNPGASSAPVLSGISFTLDRGEVLGLVGESGCGKSMTSLALIGLLPHGVEVTGGQFRLNGRVLIGPNASGFNGVRGRGIGVVFQDPMTSLNPAKTVGDQVAEPLLLAGISRETARTRVLEMLELVAIPDAVARLDSYPHELSGGMAQRVAIAMALVTKPALLIVDEPTTALDVTIQGQILDLLHKLKHELNLAILFITHDLGVVADICDRVMVMYAGEVVESARINDLFASPSHPYTRALIGITHGIDRRGGQLPVIAGAMPAPGEWPVGCRFLPRCSHSTNACAARVPLRNIEATRAARCVRLEELSGLTVI